MKKSEEAKELGRRKAECPPPPPPAERDIVLHKKLLPPVSELLTFMNIDAASYARTATAALLDMFSCILLRQTLGSSII